MISSLYESRMKLIKSAQWVSKDIIIEQDKTQLLYATSSFMRQQSSGIYNVYLS